RRDDNSQFGAKSTGSLAYGYALTPQLTARLAIGTAFKAPSFNQLYFPDIGFGGGNPNLLPETARNKEIGLDWFGPTGAHLSYTHYDNRIKNLISGWPPINIDRARIQGDSLVGSHQWGAWSAQVSADFMKPINEATGHRLPRRAAQQLKARAGYDLGAWGAGVELISVGKRYDTPTQTRAMPRYELVNLFGHYRVTHDLRLEARLDNLFDRDYETAWGYRNPGRTLFVGLRYLPK
ncbi:MAG: TonB-dependent receptor, partial [Casimicrobiaceae bacterium]|nr:TonB-dependent receptor [Casimicrobiaceae bacterium]